MKCDFTGASLMFGKNVSNSNRRTNRIFRFNIQNFKFYSSKLKRFIRAKATTSIAKLIERLGGFDRFAESRESFSSKKMEAIRKLIVSIK